MLNIGGDKHDDAYRYKMPPLQCQVEGRGNGIKTAFLNIADVASALHVMPQYIIKYFGFELGTQSTWEEQTKKGIVNGKHEVPFLQELLEKFITAFVLCPKCKLPEINMTVQEKGQQIRINCAACGDKRLLKSNHKLVGYIVNHPPPKKSASGAHRNAAKEKAKNDAQGALALEQIANTDKKEVEWHSEATLEAQRARMRKDIGEPTPEEKARMERIQEIMTAAKELGAEKNPSTLLKVFLVGGHQERKVDEIANEIRRLQVSRNLDDVQKFKLILEVFIEVGGDLKAIPKQFTSTTMTYLLKKFINNDKTLAILFINVIEDFCGVLHPKIIALFPLILKALFEEDLLQQEHIVAWHQSSIEASWVVSSDIARVTRQRAEPLVEWLSQEDEEDEDDEDAE